MLNYSIPEIEKVSFMLMNCMNDTLDIEDIIITYKDGSEKYLLDSLNVFSNQDPYYVIEFEENDEQFTDHVLELLCNHLEKCGYGSVTHDAISFEYDINKDIF